MERIVSHWRYGSRRHPHLWGSFDEALIDPVEHTWLVDRSRHHWQIEAYRQCFDDRQILALTLDDLAADRMATLNRACTFPGVAPYPRAIEEVRSNDQDAVSDAVPRPEWNPELKRAVTEELRDDAQRFLEYAGKPIDLWALDPLNPDARSTD